MSFTFTSSDEDESTTTEGVDNDGGESVQSFSSGESSSSDSDSEGEERDGEEREEKGDTNDVFTTDDTAVTAADITIASAISSEQQVWLLSISFLCRLLCR